MISHEVNYFIDSEKRFKDREKHSKMTMKSSFDFEEHMEKYDLEVGFIEELSLQCLTTSSSAEFSDPQKTSKQSGSAEDHAK